MNNIENESTLRHLRKLHKDWSEAQIEAEAKRIWSNYYTDNKERLDALQKENETAFNKAVDMEFINLLMDSNNDE